MSARTLIAGVGNIFFGDDGFGSEVARRLIADPPEDAVVTDFGIGSVHLGFELMNGYEELILVDAVARSGAPGTVYVLEPDLDAARAAGAIPDAHSTDPDSVIAMVACSSACPARVTIVGCEPGSVEPGIGLSDAVAVAVDAACAGIRSMLVREPVGER